MNPQRSYFEIIFTNKVNALIWSVLDPVGGLKISIFIIKDRVEDAVVLLDPDLVMEIW